MNIHLLDGTYELFRYYFAVPSSSDAKGQEIGAVRGVLGSVLSMIEAGTTHIGVATDHVVESFRNDLYPGYKTSEGVPALPAAREEAQQITSLLGVVVTTGTKAVPCKTGVTEAHTVLPFASLIGEAQFGTELLVTSGEPPNPFVE